MKFTSRVVLKSLNPHLLQTLIIPHSVSFLEDHFPTFTIALGIQTNTNFKVLKNVLRHNKGY